MDPILIVWLLLTLVLTTVGCLLGRRYGVEYLIGLFVASILVSQVIATKVTMIGPLAVSVTVVAYSMTFLLTDTISEFWGKRAAKKAVGVGFLALLLYVFVAQVAVVLEPAPFWEHQEAFETLLGSSWRIGLASVLAYTAAQTHDVWAFHFLKKKTHNKHLWLRNNASTAVSQVVDSLIFYTVAFFGVFPVGQLIIAAIAAKVVIAAIDTPFLYFIRWWYDRHGRPKTV